MGRDLLNYKSELALEYQQAIREFDAVVAHLIGVSESLRGKTAAAIKQNHCERILVKILSHCISIQRLSPNPFNLRERIWDPSSIAAISRCIIEAHDAFIYLADPATDAEEDEFRLALWQLHDQERRQKMLGWIGSTDPRVVDINDNVTALREFVLSNRFFTTLSASFQADVKRNRAPHMAFSTADFCERYQMNKVYYDLVTVNLSQQVHTFPFAVHQLAEFQAGTDEALRSMKMPIQYTMPYLSKVAEQASDCFGSSVSTPPARTRSCMQTWLGIYRNGAVLASS